MYVHIRRNDEAKKWYQDMLNRTVVTAKEQQLHAVVKKMQRDALRFVVDKSC